MTHARRGPLRALTSCRIRRAEAGDRPRILELLQELFAGVDAQVDLRRRFEWLYERNPHGPAITWLAIDKDTNEVAGCTSFFPRTMVLGESTVRAALGGDGFVRPAFRRQGIGAALHKASRQDMQSLGIEVMFGTPLPANFTPLERAGACDITYVARYARPLSLHALGMRGRLADWLASLVLVPRTSARLDLVSAGDSRIEDVWRQVRGRVGLTTVRDHAFVAWRFVESPSKKQRAFVVLDGKHPIATCALETVGQNLRIVDLVASPDQWGEALRAICQYARGHGSVELRLTREQARAHAIWRHGFFKRGGVHSLNILLPEGDPRAAVFRDPSRWYVTWAETDRDFS